MSWMIVPCIPGRSSWRLVIAMKTRLFPRHSISLLLAATFPVIAIAAAEEPPASSEVATAMKPYFDSHKLAGVIAIVANRDGKIVTENLIGHSDVEAGKPMREDNVFWIASMTKMFTGASIMMLVDEGKVKLDDPVTKFLPQLDRWQVIAESDKKHTLLKPLARPVTIRHLLSHTSGLVSQSELQQATGADSVSIKTRALASVTGPLQSQPGEKYAYGNVGMNIVARVIEVVSGLSYEDFLQQRIFDPLGMTETTFWPNEAQIARLANTYGPNEKKTGYTKGSIFYLTPPYSDHAHRFPEAGGGLFSTAHDILRWGMLLANNGELEGKRLLSPAAMDELRKEQTGETHVNYSLGYHLRNGMFGHDGAYGTDLSVHPDTGMIAIFLVQCSSGDQWEARDNFLKAAAETFGKSVQSR